SVFLVHAKALVVLKRLERRAVVAHIVKVPLDHDQVLVNLWRRTPVPMGLMAGIGARQAELGTKQIDRAGFSVVAGPDAGPGALLSRQRVVDAGDLTHQLGPSELVGNRLRQQRLVVHLGLVEFEAESVLVSEKTLRRQKPGHQRDGGKRGEKDYSDNRHPSPGSTVCEPPFEHDSAARQDHRIDREHIVVLGVRDFHQYEEDREDQANHAPAAVAQEPHQARQPDREQNIADIEDLLLYKCKWTEHHVLARAADVVEILNRRKVMADLPDDVGPEKRLESVIRQQTARPQLRRAHQRAEARKKLSVTSAAKFTRNEHGERHQGRARKRGKDPQRRQRPAHPQRDLGVHGDQRRGIHVTPIEMAGHVEVIKLVTKVAVVTDAGEDVQQQLGCTQANQNANRKRRKRRNDAFLAEVIGAGLRRVSNIHKIEAPQSNRFYSGLF